MAKVWKKIPGLSGYEASSDGEIKCLATDHVTHGGDAGRYLRVEVARGNKRTLDYVHILVCTAHHGKPKEGQVVMHKDDDTKNNRASNLKWGSQSENIQSAYDKGRVPGKGTAATESYMAYRDALEEFSMAIESHQQSLDQLEVLDVVQASLESVQRDPTASHMAFLSLRGVSATLPDTNLSTASVEAFTVQVGLEDTSKLRATAVKMAKQTAKVLREAWDKLVAWFKHYVKQVGMRCKQLRDKIRDSKTTAMTRTAISNLNENVKAARARVKDATDALRASNGKVTPETATMVGDASKASAELPKAVTVDKDSFVQDSGSSDMASTAQADQVVREVAALNDDIGKMNAMADRAMRTAEKELVGKQGGPEGGENPPKAKKGEFTKLSAAIQSINRTGNTLTQKALGGITKAITMTIPAPGEADKE